ncbi:PdxT/SNO family [Diplogelasinospora grovesii]|uniref:glutaminase n=1 Tax=Diplogelasinospora grovesii TaxID=303347 RepID=A0AAN6NDT7_9PEZI|nr:PdxT/SNO family [Diplogelasinospora grovesii]
MALTVGVLALQGGVIEHLSLLRKAADYLTSTGATQLKSNDFEFIEVRTKEQLSRCDALIIPGGESTTMGIVAARLGLLEPLRQFVKVENKPVWGTCAGLVMLAETASATKQGGQELVGGLDVRVLRNRFGTQIDSFVADLKLPFLGEEETPFRGVFIRAPVVEEIMASQEAAEGVKSKSEDPVEVLATVPAGKAEKAAASEDIVAVRQRNVFGTSFHPELTQDIRIHVWWLKQVLNAGRHQDLVSR